MPRGVRPTATYGALNPKSPKNLQRPQHKTQELWKYKKSPETTKKQIMHWAELAGEGLPLRSAKPTSQKKAGPEHRPQNMPRQLVLMLWKKILPTGSPMKEEETGPRQACSKPAGPEASAGTSHPPHLKVSRSLAVRGKLKMLMLD